MKPVSLTAQAVAVERAAVNLRAHIENLRRLVKQGKRGEAELHFAEKFYRDLAPAVDTMRRTASSEAA